MNGRVLKTLRRTLLQAIPTIACIIVLDFFLLRLAPGTAADYMAAEYGTATAEMMADLHKRFGTDIPLFQQFIVYIVNLAHFDLGFSARYNLPVVELILQRLPGSILLMGTALLISLIIGIASGIVMAMFERRWPDRLLSAAMLLLYSLPGFWLALILIYIFSIWFDLLPSGGYPMPSPDCTGVCAAGQMMRHIALPAGALSLFYAAIYARVMRSSVREVSLMSFVRTAVAKGAPPRRVMLRHVVPNAILPVIAVAGTHLGSILGGAVMIETVFSWPGFGRLAFEAVLKRDFTVLLGILLFSSMIVIIANMIVDLLQAWLDPRVQAR